MPEYRVEVRETCDFNITRDADDPDDAIREAESYLDDRNRILAFGEDLGCEFSNWKVTPL